MSESLRGIERWIFGEQVLSAADGLEVSVQPAWAIPMGVVGVILLVTAASMLLVYWHESTSAHRSLKVVLAGMRTGLVSIIVVMLFGWTVQRHRTDVPDVVLVLDDSASMGVVDAHDESAVTEAIKRRISQGSLDEPTRLDLAKTLLLKDGSELLGELARRYNLRCYLAGGTARSLNAQSSDIAAAVGQLSPSETASRLGNCLRDIVEQQRARPTAAVIMLTDGVVTEGQSLKDAAQLARRKSVPLFFVGLGNDRAAEDLRLAELLADEAAFVGDLVHFDFKLMSDGYTGSAVVRLKRDGDGEWLDEQIVKLGTDGMAQTIRLSHRAEKAGDFNYVVEVTPRDGEGSTENNRLARTVAVRDEIIRVLLVQSYPSYEFRFLKQVLLRQLNEGQAAEAKAAGFRTVLQEADLEYGDTDRTAERSFPASRDELFQYDVLIFGDVNPALLSPSIMNNIYAFVTERGGGLVFVAGPRYNPRAFADTPLAPLFPFNPAMVSVPDTDAAITEQFRPQLTKLGQASPMMQLADTAAENEKLWREGLTPLRWLISAPNVRPGVRVLAEHPTRQTDGNVPVPVFTLQFIGAGKVVFHATDETHRWRFRIGDIYFSRYWVQTIRYLCRAKLLGGSRAIELSTDREEYRFGETVNVRARFLDDRQAPADDRGVTVVVEREEGERRSATLHRHGSDRGVFEGRIEPLPAGEYQAWIAAPALEASPPSPRFTVVAPPGELVRTQMDSAELREAAKISGGRFYTIEMAANLLSDLPRGRQVRLASLPPRPIWNAPLLAGLFVALIVTEWLLRKRLGLL